MRNPNPSLSGSLSAFVVAGALMAGYGIVSAAQTQPKPAPPKTTQLVKRPATGPVPAVRNVPQQPKPQPKVEPRVQPKVEPKVEPKVDPKVDPRNQPKTDPKVDPRTSTGSRTGGGTGTGTGSGTRAGSGIGEGAGGRSGSGTGEGSASRGRGPSVDPHTGKVSVPEGTPAKRNPDGTSTIHPADGRVMQVDKTGRVASVHTPSGVDARYHNGTLTAMHKVGPDGTVTDVHHTPGGPRIIGTKTPDPNFHDGKEHMVRTVTDGHRGFRERDLTRRPGYRQRTYYENGRTYAVIYHNRDFGRYGAYPVYVPAYTYAPGFYTYFGTSWGAGVSFGWGPAPGYGAYFGTPAPYGSPNAWMADYLINQNLQSDAAGQQNAAQDAQPDGTQQGPDQGNVQPQPIPQGVRDTYTQEVQNTVQQDQAAAEGKPVVQEVPGALDPNHKLFQSYGDTEATDLNGGTCNLTGGDFVQREDDNPDSSKMVPVTVMAVAKPGPGHCALNARVRLSVDTLQDWYNSYCEHENAGLQAMATNAGQNGIPPAPASGQNKNPDGQGTPDTPAVMASVVQDQQSSANTMQAEVNGGGQ